MTFVERLEDVFTAVEQIEIELRGLRSAVVALKDEVRRLGDLFEEWLNGDNGEPEPEATTRSYE